MEGWYHIDFKFDNYIHDPYLESIFSYEKENSSFLKNTRPRLKSDIFSTFGSSGGGRCEWVLAFYADVVWQYGVVEHCQQQCHWSMVEKPQPAK